MAYCSLEEAWGDSYTSNIKNNSLPDRYNTQEEPDHQVFSKKIRNSNRNSRNSKRKSSKGIRNIGYEPSPSVQGIIERTPPRTKKRKTSRKRKYFQRTMKKLPKTSGHEYRYKNGSPHGQVNALATPQQKIGKVQTFYPSQASAYDSDSGDDAFSEYHPYVSDKTTEQLSKYAGSLLGSRNLHNNRFTREVDHSEDSHQGEFSSQEAATTYQEDPSDEETYAPQLDDEHSPDMMEEESHHQVYTVSPEDDIENYRNIQSDDKYNKVSVDTSTFNEKEIDQMPLINKLNELDNIEDQYDSETETMPPRVSSSRENMFNIILYIVSGIFIIFILDIFVRLGRTLGR